MGQENPKYHVSDDGKVFIVNDDGTTTEYGRVVKRPPRPIQNFVLWLIAILSLVVAFGLVSWLIGESDIYYNYKGIIIPCLLLLVLVLAGCVIRLNSKILADK